MLFWEYKYENNTKINSKREFAELFDAVIGGEASAIGAFTGQVEYFVGFIAERKDWLDRYCNMS